MIKIQQVAHISANNSFLRVYTSYLWNFPIGLVHVRWWTGAKKKGSWMVIRIKKPPCKHVSPVLFLYEKKIMGTNTSNEFHDFQVQLSASFRPL